MTQTTVVELPEPLDPMRVSLNRGLMVGFINRDLINRSSLDIRKSVVFYDADLLFEFALNELPNEALLKRLHDETNIRFWSKGIK